MRPAAKLERETGFEPATSTLARSHSTAELLPLRNWCDYNKMDSGERRSESASGAALGELARGGLAANSGIYDHGSPS